MRFLRSPAGMRKAEKDSIHQRLEGNSEMNGWDIRATEGILCDFYGKRFKPSSIF